MPRKKPPNLDPAQKMCAGYCRVKGADGKFRSQRCDRPATHRVVDYFFVAFEIRWEDRQGARSTWTVVDTTGEIRSCRADTFAEAKEAAGEMMRGEVQRRNAKAKAITQATQDKITAAGGVVCEDCAIQPATVRLMATDLAGTLLDKHETCRDCAVGRGFSP